MFDIGCSSKEAEDAREQQSRRSKECSPCPQPKGTQVAPAGQTRASDRGMNGWSVPIEGKSFLSVFWREEPHSLSIHHGISTRGPDQDIPGLVVTYPHHSAKNWRSANTRSGSECRCGGNRRGERSTR